MAALAVGRGKLEQKGKNENSVSKIKNMEITHTKSRPRLSGKVSTFRLTEGASVSRYKRIEYKYEQTRKRFLTEEY